MSQDKRNKNQLHQSRIKQGLKYINGSIQQKTRSCWKSNTNKFKSAENR
jgi:hypothetical protein